MYYTLIFHYAFLFQGEKEFEIYDIKCHLLEMNKSYVLEIMPWMKNICRMKNFSLLISGNLQLL